MRDVQGQSDDREIALDRVGVCDLACPVVVLDRDHDRQHTVARLTMSVDLPQEFKGTHMSRFVEVLDEHRGELTMRTLPSICEALRDRLDAQAAQLEARFPYFLEKAAPVSGATALTDYDVTFRGEVDGDHRRFTLIVTTPVTSLCPCSKAISEYGAHNQRGRITIEVDLAPSDDADGFHLIWIEELVEIAERSASSPVYPLLKRADERYVTMHAYDHPVFVEDMVRNAAAALRDDDRVTRFVVSAVNDESIHNHGAFAEVRWPPGPRS